MSEPNHREPFGDAAAGLRVLRRLREQHAALIEDGWDGDGGLLPGSGADHAALYYELIELAGLPMSDPCYEGHAGPVSVYDTEPIDGGVALYLRCATCMKAASTSIDLDELEW